MNWGRGVAAVSEDFLPKPAFSDNGLDEAEYETVASAYFLGLSAKVMQLVSGSGRIRNRQRDSRCRRRRLTLQHCFRISWSDAKRSPTLPWVFGRRAPALAGRNSQPLSGGPTQAELDAVREFPTAQKPGVAPARRRLTHR